ncbi:MFS transporter, NNP family, nitrate/nitrite transporter [Bathymodiolus platifrons methanotrophic gill symbiont]|uniref:MFS transporter n=1 Tax=Bathymodiolus platifrons methanotrophic gill symbiont TaxID=113268 RepID=UPI000B41FC84|nr:nitrate/nitrite transporter [Bathymodiolus platifrons methanotrophic gill symbiont]MCK5869509.1 NarK/NasA family nitrate transporter [Methyloprofundus sp.]TXK97310.1 MFS transporter [Methylococcaceae bacterium CS4]TXK99183.1 MFS transporter [Methylococcaceae bacterium CS5]TXL08611.1 MFS transporter [Methylococcaceae bacterium CS1]TXL08748.1 MFS transporter [Methylococcaceae bacterium CS3]TXL12255.1 MFS transporter [Methylococcaceae bacterium CS2]TXL15881.1 MFS transporter [Methylococcacea
MHELDGVTSGQQTKSLAVSTIAFTICFAVWTIFSIIGIKIKQNLGLTDTEFGLLVATPILTGSLSRIFLGIWTDQFGGRIVYFVLMLATSVSVYLLSMVSTYPMYLLAALGVGLAGGSFAVGISYVSRWYDAGHQGTALGIFGMGNVGAAVTNFGAPFLLIAYGWENVAKIYAVVLFVMAIIFWLTTQEDPFTKARKEKGEKVRPALMQLEPLKHLRVWRFAAYYFFVFGAYVALALWLPRYYMGVYDLEIATAGMLAACYALPGSIFRALGGWMSDKIGARRVMYVTFLGCLTILFFLSYPSTEYTIHGINGPINFSLEIGIVPFVILTVFLGFFMSLGKAAVYKHIPVYYPDHVGAVGGLVGMIGGLGGFILPICFGFMNDVIGVWTSCFMLLFVIVGISVIWMHISIVLSDRKQHPELKAAKSLPEMMHGLDENYP